MGGDVGVVDVQDEELRKQLTKDGRWLIGIMVSVALVFSGFQFRQATVSGEQTRAISGLEASVAKLTDTLHKLLHEDISDLKSRMLVMEQRNILPDARAGIERLDERIRVLEKATK